MASEYLEYEFTLPDGSTAYEMVTKRADFWAFYRMHKAVAGRPHYEGWSGAPAKDDPNGTWIDDLTGCRVSAYEGDK